jgi:hypothetical protein
MLFPIKSNDHTVEMSDKMEMSDKKKGNPYGVLRCCNNLLFK